jgi:hypothetical protein
MEYAQLGNGAFGYVTLVKQSTISSSSSNRDLTLQDTVSEQARIFTDNLFQYCNSADAHVYATPALKQSPVKCPEY